MDALLDRVNKVLGKNVKHDNMIDTIEALTDKVEHLEKVITLAVHVMTNDQLDKLRGLAKGVK